MNRMIGNHLEGHPVMHALLQWRDEREDMLARIARHDAIRAELRGLSCGDVQAEPLIREAVDLISTMYQKAAGSHCSCRVARWYIAAMGEMRAQAAQLCEGRYAVSTPWAPLTSGGRR